MGASAGWLQGWHDFFLLIGGASATLMGLVFVSATVAASIPNDKLGPLETRQLWATPVLAAFLRVLVFSAIGLFPEHSMLTFGAIVGTLSTLDCVRWVQVIVTLRRHQAKVGDLELSDWWWQSIAPALASVAMAAFSARLAGGHPHAMFGLASAAILHLSIGIHNAWDSAEYLSTVM